MNKNAILLSLVFTLFCSYPALAEKQLADEPLAVKTRPVPPNVMLLLSRSGTMNGQQNSGGGSDVFYAPGYNPDTRYVCPKEEGGKYKILEADPNKELLAYFAVENKLAYDVPSGYPFFEYGGSHYVFGDTSHTNMAGWGVTSRCFDPDATYKARLSVENNLKTRSAGHVYGFYRANSGVMLREYSGNFLNWYYSAFPAKWADNTVTGGMPATPKVQLVSTPNTQVVRAGNVGVINKASCLIRYPIPAATPPATSYEYGIGGNTGCAFVVPHTVPPSPLPNNAIGLKQEVSFITERWSVARDVVKKVVRDAANINLAIGTFTTTAAIDQKNGSHVLRLESDFNYYSGDNTDADQIALKEGVIRDVNDLTVTRVNAHRSPTGAAVLAGANHIFKGWSNTGSVDAIESVESQFHASHTTGPSELGSTTFNVSHQKGGSGRAGAVSEDNWCQKNAIVVLTDGLATSEVNLLDSNAAFNSYVPLGVNATDFTNLDSVNNRDRYFSGLLFYACPKCDKNLIRIMGKLHDTDWLPSVKGKQNIESYIIAFGSEDMLAEDSFRMAGFAGGGGKSNFYAASDGNQISKAFNDIMARVKSGAVSLTAVAASTVPDRNINNLDSAYAVQATYDTEFWSGELRAFKMTLEGELVDANNESVTSTSSTGITPFWEAGKLMNQQYLLPNSARYLGDGVKARNVYTYNAKGVRFGGISMSDTNANSYFNQLSSKMQADIDRMALGDQKARYDLMMYLLGDIKNEADYPAQTAVKPYRSRGTYMDYDEDGVIDNILSGGILGDITNSSPVYVKEPAKKWKEPGYKDYYEQNKNRAAMIYAGSNRGYLHGFTVEGDASSRYPAGAERFAYMPSMLANDEDIGSELGNSGFAYLANSRYEHKYMVDLPPTVSDVYMDFYTDLSSSNADPEWRTILVGGLRSGGKGIFALDITCPFQTTGTGGTCDDEAFNERNVLWEFSAEDDNDLGYTFAQPIIAKVNYDLPNSSAQERNGNGSGRWAAIVPNGYHSDTGRAALFILFLDGPSGANGAWQPGKDYIKIIVGGEEDNVNSKNGLSEPVAIDLDNDGIIDHIYAGDLKGQMWTFDVRTNILYEE